MGAAADLVLHQLHLVDEHDHAGAAAYETEEYVTPFASLHGPDAIRAAREVLAAGFPDAHHEIRNVVDAAPTSSSRPRGRAPTPGRSSRPRARSRLRGRATPSPKAVVAHVEADHITSTHIYYDNIALLSALGLVPSPG